MTTALPFFGRDQELALLHQRWQATTTGLGPNIVTLVGETGTGKSRIIQQFYQHLTIDHLWDPDHFWPDAFQTHATQLQVNPSFPADTVPAGPPRFVWLGARWSSTTERNLANSAALPTLKEQLTSIADHVTNAYPRQQRIVTAIKQDAVTIAKEMVSGQVIDMAEGVITSFFPYYKLITTIFNLAAETRGVFGINTPTPTLTDQLTEFFGRWFAQPQPIPMILWLDDVQWIDAEATQFFAQLVHTAYEQHWPLLLVATCWPTEWRAFPEMFFLKPSQLNDGSAWPWVVVHELVDADPAQIRALLCTAFPGLLDAQVELLVTRAGGNFLTMVENIAELQSKPRYFVDFNPNNPLSEIGLERIHTWQSQRQIRIAQRFHQELDNDIQEFLARASQAGINTQFLRAVLVRFARLQPNVGDIATILQRCQETLALVAPLSDNLHEFRDRGYFTVARAYFTEWLAPSEAVLLQHALRDELHDRIQQLFDDRGELISTPTMTAPQRTSSHEQSAVLQLALQLFGSDSAIAVRTVVVFCHYCVTNHTWSALRQIGPTIQHIDWASHAGTSIGWDAFQTVARAYFLAGLTESTTLYRLLLTHQQQQPIPNPTIISETLRIIGQSAYYQRDYADAQHSYQQALTLIEAMPPDVQDARLLTVTLHDLGLIYDAQTDPVAANASFQKALGYARQLTSHAARTVADECLLATIHDSIGQVELARGDWQAAHGSFQAALEICQRLAASDDTLMVQEHYTYAIKAMGHWHDINGNSDEALAAFITDRAICAKLVTLRGTPTDIALLVASITMQGRIYRRQGNLPAAQHALTESLPLVRRLISMRGIPSDIQSLGTTLSALGATYRDLGHNDQAAPYIDEALAVARQLAHPQAQPDTLRELSLALADKGTLCRDRAEWQEALTYHREECTVSQQLVAQRGSLDDLRTLCGAYVALAHTYNALGDRTNARSNIQHAADYAQRVHHQAPHIISAAEVADIQMYVARYQHDEPAPALPQVAPLAEPSAPPPTTATPQPTPAWAWIITLIIVCALILWRINH